MRSWLSAASPRAVMPAVLGTGCRPVVNPPVQRVVVGDGLADAAGGICHRDSSDQQRPGGPPRPVIQAEELIGCDLPVASEGECGVCARRWSLIGCVESGANPVDSSRAAVTSPERRVGGDY